MSAGTITWGRSPDGKLIPIAVTGVRTGEPTKVVTPAVREDIIRRHKAGDTYLMIAFALAVSRSTIAGVIYRAKQKGETFDHAEKVAAAPKSPSPQRPVTSKVAAPAPAAAAVPAPTSEAESRGISLLDLRDNHCRWPLWGNGGAQSEKRYCGKPARKGQSYCAHCYGLSYSKQFTRDIDRKLNLRRLARAA